MMQLRSLITVSAMTLVLLTGCAAPLNEPAPAGEPEATTDPVAATPNAANICEELGDGLSDAYNAWTGNRDGELDEAQYVELG